MATNIQIRNLKRNRIAIGNTAVTDAATVTVDLDDPVVRRDLHRYLSQIVVVGAA